VKVEDAPAGIVLVSDGAEASKIISVQIDIDEPQQG
jgi:hypothetical protein